MLILSAKSILFGGHCFAVQYASNLNAVGIVMLFAGKEMTRSA